MTKTSIINYNMLSEHILNYGKKIGRAGLKPVLLLYYVMKSKNTPWKDKAAIFTAIAYVVLPIDILSAKRLPIIGWIDEVTSLVVAYNRMKKYITPEMEQRVDAQLDKWFPEYAIFKELPKV